MSPFEFRSDSEADTARLGEAFARALTPGTVVALVGNLGAGKTRFVRAVAEAAGVDPKTVNSPTFVLVQEYEGNWPIYHFDTYRLHDTHDFLDLGADEYMRSAGVCFIEWADRVRDVLPADAVRVEIEITGETSRLFRFTAGGPVAEKIVQELAANRDLLGGGCGQ
jgi:tRNA threonylcarbamoyladenosine biosynthesis protein TsaE